MALKIVPFEKAHVKEGFNCGKPELDEYFMKYAGQDIRRGLAALFVAVDEGDNRIYGYYNAVEYRHRHSNYPSCFAKETAQIRRRPGDTVREACRRSEGTEAGHRCPFARERRNQKRVRCVSIGADGRWREGRQGCDFLPKILI